MGVQSGSNAVAFSSNSVFVRPGWDPDFRDDLQAARSIFIRLTIPHPDLQQSVVNTSSDPPGLNTELSDSRQHAPGRLEAFMVWSASARLIDRHKTNWQLLDHQWNVFLFFVVLKKVWVFWETLFSLRIWWRIWRPNPHWTPGRDDVRKWNNWEHNAAEAKKREIMRRR